MCAYRNPSAGRRWGTRSSSARRSPRPGNAPAGCADTLPLQVPRIRGNIVTGWRRRSGKGRRPILFARRDLSTVATPSRSYIYWAPYPVGAFRCEPPSDDGPGLRGVRRGEAQRRVLPRAGVGLRAPRAGLPEGTRRPLSKASVYLALESRRPLASCQYICMPVARYALPQALESPPRPLCLKPRPPWASASALNTSACAALGLGDSEQLRFLLLTDLRICYAPFPAPVPGVRGRAAPRKWGRCGSRRGTALQHLRRRAGKKNSLLLLLDRACAQLDLVALSSIESPVHLRRC